MENKKYIKTFGEIKLRAKIGIKMPHGALFPVYVHFKICSMTYT